MAHPLLYTPLLVIFCSGATGFSLRAPGRHEVRAARHTSPVGSSTVQVLHTARGTEESSHDANKTALPDLTDLTDAMGDAGKAVSNVVGDAVQEVGNTVEAAVEDASKTIAGAARGGGSQGPLGGVIGSLVPGLAPTLQDAGQVDLGGLPVTTINWLSLILVLVLALVCTAAALLEAYFPETCAPRKGRPRLWVIVTLIASYAILLPALLSILISFAISFDFMGATLLVTKLDGAADGPPGPITESTVGLVELLFRTGGALAACLVVLYAIGDPLIKMALLIMGEVLRFSSDKTWVAYSRRCLFYVQVVSKWACPDMFAYILMTYLLRHVNDSVPEIGVKTKLGMGFVCYSIFCVLSTISSLAIREPELEADAATEPPMAVRCLGQRGAERLAFLLAGLCAVFLGFGMFTPVMAVRLNTNLFIEPQGPLPAIAAPVIEGLGLDRANSDVNLVDCTTQLLKWATNKGEATDIFAFLMLLVFVLALSWCGVISLFLTACTLPDVAQGRAQEDALASSSCGWWWSVAVFLRHLAMLDVCIMGVVIVVTSGSVYKDQGVELYLLRGTAILAASEVCHYVLYYLMGGLCQQVGLDSHGGRRKTEA